MYDAIYARQSVDKEDSISIESQIAMCEHETRGNNFKVYSDKGYSGKNLDRPDFERLVEDIKQGLIRRVIVYKLDRISRSILDFAGLIQFFEQHKVEFVSVTEKFDTSTPVGRAMLNICIVFAQLERETIQQRVKDAFDSRSRRGFFMGGTAPYGFRKAKTTIDGKKTSKFVIHKEEAEHVKLIFSLYADSNNSLNDVLRYLLDNGISQLNDKAWSTSRLSEILRHPVYVQSDLSIYEFYKSHGATIHSDVSEFDGRGCYLYTGTASSNGKRSDVIGREIVIAPHKGFISSEEWLKCRLRSINSKYSTKTQRGTSSWLLGKLKCGNCGYALAVRKSGKNRLGVCSNYSTMMLCKGTGGRVDINALENYVLDAMRDKLAKFKTLSGNTKNETPPKVRENDIKIAKLDTEIADLLTKVTGANTILMDYINEKVEELDHSRKELQQENISIRQTVKADKLATIYDHVEDWENTSFENKKSALDMLAKAIHISNAEIAISWNF
ncbi:MAG: recombinase family protein [Oscillospiraceae bacterium]|nr:recombinase family protein [Oscillospiraceae bacterium]